MASVYRVLRDAHYQRLEPVDMAAFLDATNDGWRFDGTLIGDHWKPLGVYIREPMLQQPDIWQIHGSFAFENAAAEVVQLSLDQSSEQLELSFEGRILVVPNITYVIDCLDKAKSDYDAEFPHIVIGRFKTSHLWAPVTGRVVAC